MGPIMTVVRDALEIIKDPEHWCQEYYQHDKDGNRCNWEDGYSFCALGALGRASGGDAFKAVCVLQRVSERLFGATVQIVNDGRPGVDKATAHAEICKVFETALENWKDRDPTEEEYSKRVQTALSSSG